MARSSYWATSEGKGGRGPTQESCPSRQFRNCGSSSIASGWAESINLLAVTRPQWELICPTHREGEEPRGERCSTH